MIDFPYSFRHSKRAKQISMRIVPDRGLEVVLPVGASEARGLRFLKKHQDWVRKHADMLAPKQILQEQQRYTLINEISFPCIDQTYKVRYLQMQRKHIDLKQPLPDVLIFTGDIKDSRCCQSKLDTWLKQQAKKHLLPLLKQFSDETGLIYRNASIRIQRTRWGSCSAEGDISLNAKLLYQSYAAVRYVMIHELCHLQELNHSSRFWHLVGQHVPNYKQLKVCLD
ncbi:MAG: hypothetical protein COB66_06550 [Coxiella sp. (in: Bacteria)]|nr:MAG: hypothetical protein COB66_06550 [Coxiella sp. (in: g-proteobacteria)]